MQRLGHTRLVGDAAKMRAMVVRKTKADRRDALHSLDLLRHDRFPTTWAPAPATRDLRALLTHRMRLVRIRNIIKNGLHAIALNSRLTCGTKLLRQAGRAQLQALALPPHTARLRDQSFGADPPSSCWGPSPASPTAHTWSATSASPRPCTPLPRHISSAASPKQGSPSLRFVLGQAATHAARMDPDLKRTYGALVHRRGRPKAKVAVASKLLVRLFIMLGGQIDDDEFCRRGRPAPGAV